MICPKCGYEDMIFSLPANVSCSRCGYEYKYKRYKMSKEICPFKFVFTSGVVKKCTLVLDFHCPGESECPMKKYRTKMIKEGWGK